MLGANMQHKLDNIGEVKCPQVRGCMRWLSELCNVLEEHGYKCYGDRQRSIAFPMKVLKEIKPEGHEKPIEIKQWVCITNNALLGWEGDEKTMDIDVYFRDTPPYTGGYIIGHVEDLSPETQAKLKEEVKEFLKRHEPKKLPKYAQCTIII